VAVIFAPLSSLALWSAAVLRRFSMQPAEHSSLLIIDIVIPTTNESEDRT